MGQVTHGLLFGIRAPQGEPMTAEENDYSEPGLLDLWRQREGVDVGDRWHRKGIVDAWPESNGAVRLLGVWIAVGASGIDGVPSLKVSLSMREIECTEPYTSRLVWARAEWARFSAWCKSRGLSLGEPDVWLTTTGVS